MKPSASRCLFFALLAGCSSQITSPDLALSTIAPQAICNDQITTEVTASGMGFTPLPVDTFTAAPHLQLPAVLVDLATRPDGSAGPDSDVLVPDDPQPPHDHVR